MDRSLEATDKANEKQKKSFYNDGILNVERASFMLLVLMTKGGMGKECCIMNKLIAEMISDKNKKEVLLSDVPHSY